MILGKPKRTIFSVSCVHPLIVGVPVPTDAPTPSVDSSASPSTDSSSDDSSSDDGGAIEQDRSSSSCALNVDSDGDFAFFAHGFSLGQIRLPAHLESSDKGHSEMVWSRCCVYTLVDPFGDIRSGLYGSF